MAELVAQANDDLRTKTSLLEARYLCGDEGLFAEFEKIFLNRCVHGHEKEFLEWRVADQADRHSKAGNTVFLQEPNVKNGCGGLRDYQNLIWLGRVKRGLRNTQEFVDAGLLTASERKQLDRAYDQLLRIRTELHYQQKRSGDILTLRLQGQIADSFGYKHRTILRRIEAFMRDYYHHASLLFNLGNMLGRRLCGNPRNTKPRWAFLPFAAKHREEIDGFLLEHGELEAISPGTFADEPVRLVRVFLIAQQHNADLGAELKMRLRRRLNMVNRAFIYQTTVRDALLAIFSRKGQVGHALRTMHELGFLGRLFPEFGPLTCLVQHEFFHRYTADEHTLVCIEMLDRIIDAKAPPFSKYKPLFQQVTRPHILYLAMLLHDSGRADNGPRHAEASAANAVRVARRMKITGTDLSTLVFLVDHHLTMSEIARRKNLENEETIIEFARVVETQERLDMLMLLTFADTQGTGAARSYSDWKDLLLWQLYHRTSRALSGIKEFVDGVEEAPARGAAAAAQESRPQVRPRRSRGAPGQFAARLFRHHLRGADPRAHQPRAQFPQVPDQPRRRRAAADDPLAPFSRAGPLGGEHRLVGPRISLRPRHRRVLRRGTDDPQGRHLHAFRQHRHPDLLRCDGEARGGARRARPRGLRKDPRPGDGHATVRFQPGLREADQGRARRSTTPPKWRRAWRWTRTPRATIRCSTCRRPTIPACSTASLRPSPTPA